MKPLNRASEPWFSPLMRGATYFALAISCAVLLICASRTSLADPLFAAPWRSFDAGEYVVYVAIADLNGDGKHDLAVANSEAGTVSVLLGNGDGTFGSRRDYPSGSSTAFVAI